VCERDQKDQGQNNARSPKRQIDRGRGGGGGGVEGYIHIYIERDRER